MDIMCFSMVLDVRGRFLRLANHVPIYVSHPVCGWFIFCRSIFKSISIFSACPLASQVCHEYMVSRFVAVLLLSFA